MLMILRAKREITRGEEEERKKAVAFPWSQGKWWGGVGKGKNNSQINLPLDELEPVKTKTDLICRCSVGSGLTSLTLEESSFDVEREIGR